MKLNSVGRHKFGDVQQSMIIRSRSEKDTDIAEMIIDNMM